MSDGHKAVRGGVMIGMDAFRTPHQLSLAEKLAVLGTDLIRWCTPALLPEQPIDPRHDLSISYGPAGSMLDHSGWFARAEDHIAALHGAAKAFLVPAGSTTSNLVTIRALARSGKPGVVLVDRQAHHSMIRGLTMFGVPWRFLDTCGWNATFECPEPTTPADVLRSVNRADGEVAAVCVVSTTYTGQTADLAGIRRVVDREAPGAVLVADGAWESHYPFHDGLASYRAAKYAHIVSHSTHKAAGALQPGAILLWNPGPLPYEVVDSAYQDLMSTSASFLITASIDWAYEQLSKRGQALIGRSADLTSRLAEGLLDGIPGLQVLTDARPRGVSDPTKVTVALPSGPVTGYEVGHALIEEGIVVEKASPATVTFLTTFGLDEHRVDVTVDAMAGAVQRLAARGGSARATVPDPFAAAPAVHAIAPWVAQKASRDSSVVVPIDEAVGRVAVEQVEAYPPGVAIISEGFEVTRSAVDWLRITHSAGGSIVARDPELKTLRVLATAN